MKSLSHKSQFPGVLFCSGSFLCVLESHKNPAIWHPNVVRIFYLQFYVRRSVSTFTYGTCNTAMHQSPLFIRIWDVLCFVSQCCNSGGRRILGGNHVANHCQDNCHFFKFRVGQIRWHFNNRNRAPDGCQW